MKKILFILVSILPIWGVSSVQAQDLKAVFNDYLNNYTRSDANIKPRSNVKSLNVDDDRQQICVECEGGFEDQFFSEKDVNRIYNDFRALLPARYKGYEVIVMTDRHDIRDLVPNALRSGQKHTSRMWKK